ncbi:MAG: endonuclease/exonuclease/phosphatase family protein [Candidatus Hydrogenedentes bacterium]|nr:endonuclease/exonuclease/phosphatase family protein [Candidatus Hydrogenedentota bacterium]
MVHTKSDFFKLRIEAWGLLTAFGVIISGTTVAGFLGSFAWFLDLFCHFRVQYFVSLAVVSLLLLIRGRRKTAAFFGVGAVVNLATILPFYLGSAERALPTASSLRAVLVNVNTQFGDLQRVSQFLKEQNPDLIVLEEVNTKWLDGLRPVTDSYHYSKSEPRDDNFGIALFSRISFSRCEVVYIGDAEVPSLVAELESPDDGEFTVLATHPLPPGGAVYSRWRNNQLTALPEHVRAATSPVLLLGDLNVTPWSPHFRRLVKDSGLKDSARGHGIQPTWPTFNPLFLIPVDHCLHSAEIRILRREIGPNVGSDHYPMIVDFALVSANEPNVPAA